MPVVKVQYSYRVDYVPKGARNSREAAVKDEAFVDITEASDEEAPVACRIPPSCFKHGHGIPSSRKLDYRHFAGRFWNPVFHDHYVGRDPKHLSVEEFEKRAAKGGQFSHGKGVPHMTPVDLAKLAPCRFVGSPEISSQDAAKMVRLEAADLLIVDGALWRPTIEPILKVGGYGNFHSDYWDLEVEPADQVTADNPPDVYFRVSEATAAIASLLARRKGSGDKRTSGRRLDGERGIEVPRPELFTFRYDMRPRVEALAKSVVDSMKGHLAEADLKYMTDYVAVRDAVASAPVDHQKLVDLLDGDILPRSADDERWHWPNGLEAIRADWERWAEIGPPIEDGDLEAIAQGHRAA